MKPARPPRFAPVLETLEGRAVPSVTPLRLTFLTTEGVSASPTVATFTANDPTPQSAGNYSATIDWGDGVTGVAGTVAGNGSPFTVSGSHTYQQAGIYAVKVAIHDAVDNTNATANSNANVGDAALTVLPVTLPAATDAAALSNVIVASFKDANTNATVADHTAIINWGDGQTAPGVVTFVSTDPSGVTFNVTGSHSYDEGNFTITTRITDFGGASVAATTAATVVEGVPHINSDSQFDYVHGTQAQNYVNEVYQSILRRPVDHASLVYWAPLVGTQSNRTTLVTNLTNSSEFKQIVVGDLYLSLLHRVADPSGLTFWSNYLVNGGTREGVAESLIGSPEYFTNRAGSSNTLFLNALYTDVYAHGGDSGGMSFWTGQLNGGTTRQSVATSFYSTQEYRQDVVKTFYLQLLERPADAAALNYWALTPGGQFAAGAKDEQLIIFLAASPEFYGKTGLT